MFAKRLFEWLPTPQPLENNGLWAVLCGRKFSKNEALEYFSSLLMMGL